MQEKKQNWFLRHKIISAVLIIIVLAIIFGDKNTGNQKTSSIQPTNVSPTIVQQKPTSIPTSTSTNKTLNLGDEGYLRLPNNKDPEQIIILATDKQYISDVSKALLANDMQGILELAQAGKAFGVHVGAKVKVIDMEVGSRRVRVEEVTKSVDDDKVGQAGWVAFEFVSAK